ncbi:chalcone isomerase family protein [Ideonella sp.]|uniref:chalcone isomerase family protein n=1 Tax=Ideonella sp. TaxID=1929293 RepID=UPI0035B4F97E
MQRRLLLALPLSLPWLGRAEVAAPPELRGEWPDAPAPRRQGQGRMRFLGLPVYDITLWAPEPVRAGEADRQPLALEITYRRALSGERIAERSLAEMQRAGPLDEATSSTWLATMKRLFPDVGDGDRITGVQVPGQAARFHLNGRFVGELRDTRFTALFFGIWLARWTSEPGLRQALLEGPR